jgi:hypothetical protein
MVSEAAVIMKKCAYKEAKGFIIAPHLGSVH